MSSPYGYGASSTIRNFKCIRLASLWAGGFGMVQSIVWMALTITAILSYNCVINLPAQYTYGSMVESVFLFTYFRSSSCTPKPAWNYSILQSVNIVLDPQAILIWDCIYLGVAVCWLLTSSLLLKYIRKDNAKQTAGVMLAWVFFTCCVCLMDAALGVIFGIDYSAFKNAADGYNLAQAEGEVVIDATPLVGGMVSAFFMIIVSFKGFILWFINAGLMICLLTLSIRTLKDKDDNDTLFMPRKESDDILTTHQPIKAYEEEIAYNNIAFVPDSTANPQTETIELNQESIARAARISTDVTLKDRRFRNLDAFQQYPPPRYAGNNNSNSNNNNNNNNIYGNKPRSTIPSAKEDDISMSPTIATAGTGLPAPDYTPPMTRANQNSTQNNGILRNQRY